MTVSVGGKDFVFKKPTMKHLRFLSTKAYDVWFASDALKEFVSSDEDFQACAKKWKEFCEDVFVSYGEELEFERLDGDEIIEVARSFFVSLAGTQPAQEKPIPASPASETAKQKG
jgi:hypothetical protein